MNAQFDSLKILPLSLLLAVSVLTGCRSSDAVKSTSAAGETKSSRRTYVIVHGAWGGSWAFKDVERLLREEGHEVCRVSLTGQGDRVHLAGTNVNLSLHIQDAVNAIMWEKLENIVLVGHSYGGVVITGVADRIPERIAHMIYLDAILPENGESVQDAMPDLNRSLAPNEFIQPFWLKPNTPVPHDVPHPANTFLEKIVLTNQTAARALPTTYVLTVDRGSQPEKDAFHRFSERAKSRGWPVITMMETDHNPQWSNVTKLLEVLESAPGKSGPTPTQK